VRLLRLGCLACFSLTFHPAPKERAELLESNLFWQKEDQFEEMCTSDGCATVLVLYSSQLAFLEARVAMINGMQEESID